MKKILFCLSILGLTMMSCDRSSDTPEPTEKPAPTPTPTPPNPPAKDVAKLNINATGRNSFNNIELWIGYKDTNSFVVEERIALPQDGKITIDVSKYIGKTLTVQAMEKNGNTTTELPNPAQVTIVKNQTHNISLNLTEAPKKVYKANITVTKNGKSQSDIKVYAVPSTHYALLETISITGSKTLDNIKEIISVKTDENGVAKFTNLQASLTKNYQFVVITKESSPMQQGKYASVSIKLDDTTTQTGTIDFKSTSLKINITSNKNIDNTSIKLYSPLSTYTPTIKNGKIEIEDINAGEYVIMNTTSSKECIVFSTYTISVKEDVQNEKNITANVGNTLTLKNNSSNSYTVVVKHADGKEETFVMKGNTTKELQTSTGTATISVKQNEGYVFNPTEEKKSANITCGKTSSVCFPSDKCN